MTKKIDTSNWSSTNTILETSKDHISITSGRILTLYILLEVIQYVLF